jgi:hypothetical protein
METCGTFPPAVMFVACIFVDSRSRRCQYIVKNLDLTCNHGIGRFPEHIRLHAGARLEGMSGES